MDGAIQDDELWRRAFSASAGLFFDDQVSDFGPFLTGGDGPAAETATAGVADPVVGMPLPLPSPASSNVASIAPMPFVAPAPAPAAPARQQQQQHQPHVRVQIACRPSTLVAAPLPPAPPASEEPSSATARPAPPPPQRQQRKIGPAPESARGRANVPAVLSSNAAESAAPAPAQQAGAEGPSAEQQASFVYFFKGGCPAASGLCDGSDHSPYIPEQT